MVILERNSQNGRERVRAGWVEKGGCGEYSIAGSIALCHFCSCLFQIEKQDTLGDTLHVQHGNTAFALRKNYAINSSETAVIAPCPDCNEPVIFLFERGVVEAVRTEYRTLSEVLATRRLPG